MSEEKDSFMQKFTDIILNWRIILLLLFIIISFVAINYKFSNEGIVINGIVPGSTAQQGGISYDSDTSQGNLERIIYINNQEVNTPENYYNIINSLQENTTINIKTNKNNEGYNVIFNDTNSLGISVITMPTSNIKLGIELEGGSRLILKPLSELSESQFDLLIDNLQSRLDVYGASGTKVNKIEDAFSNERFVIVESISSNKNDIFELIKRQGNFEAKIGNTTVFTGENINRVVNDPSHEILQGCSQTATENYICTYAFSVEIDTEGTNSFYEKARSLSVVGDHLSEKVSFHLDGEKITELNIASSFKFQKISSPQITISGNEMGTRDLALESAEKEMDFLQAILSTQSLPSELEVVQSYSISSSLGKSLLENALIVAIASVILVATIIAIRYRRIEIFIGIAIALITEIIIILGISAFMRLTIDLAAIGGLIAAIGTGVDDQIIITDEYFRNKKKRESSRKRIKNAIYIIMIAYFTTLAAMIPLYFAGLKILQGFAFMIVIGVTVGVLITRPAYAAYLRIITTSRQERKEEEEEDEKNR